MKERLIISIGLIVLASGCGGVDKDDNPGTQGINGQDAQNREAAIQQENARARIQERPAYNDSIRVRFNANASMRGGWNTSGSAGGVRFQALLDACVGKSAGDYCNLSFEDELIEASCIMGPMEEQGLVCRPPSGDMQQRVGMQGRGPRQVVQPGGPGNGEDSQ